MKKSVTLYTYIQSEWIRRHQHYPYSDTEFNQIAFYDSSFMSKLLTFDDEVLVLLDSLFPVLKSTLTDNTYQSFIRYFILTFQTRAIKFQTIEVFKSMLYGYVVQSKDLLEGVFNLDGYLKGVSTNNNASLSNSKGKHSNAHQDLPQEKVDIDLNTEGLEYATHFNIGKNQNEGSTNSNSSSTNLSVDTLNRGMELLERIKNQLDKLLFSQIQ